MNCNEKAGDRLTVCEQELLYAFVHFVSISSNFLLAQRVKGQVGLELLAGLLRRMHDVSALLLDNCLLNDFD